MFPFRYGTGFLEKSLRKSEKIDMKNNSLVIGKPNFRNAGPIPFRECGRMVTLSLLLTPQDLAETDKMKFISNLRYAPCSACLATLLN
jgi:hypothetical protein